MKNRERKKAKNKRLWGIGFILIMILCCVGLYFFNGTQQYAMLDSSIPTVVPVNNTRAYPSVDVFFDRIKDFSHSYELLKKEDSATEIAYSVNRGELPGCEIVLSLRNGGVCGFTILSPAAVKPEDISEAPSAIEVSLYEQRLAQYELELAWMNEAFGALLRGLDIMGDLTYGDRMDMLSQIQQTSEDGKSRSGDIAGFDFSVNLINTADGSIVAAGVQIIE